MTINAVISANSKLPITIMVILYFRANGPLLLCSINNSNDKSQGINTILQLFLNKKLIVKKLKDIYHGNIFLILKIYQI